MPKSIRFTPGGGVRKVFERSDRRLYPGVVPQRASRVEVIQAGPNRGRFHVEFLPITGLTPQCLVDTFEDHEEAVKAERKWLKENWIERATDCG